MSNSPPIEKSSPDVLECQPPPETGREMGGWISCRSCYIVFVMINIFALKGAPSGRQEWSPWTTPS